MRSWSTCAPRSRGKITGKGDVCLTCSFQAEDVLLTKLAIALDPRIPILFLDTGYHFKETYEYRDRIAREWGSEPDQPAAGKDSGRAGGRARLALSDRARPLLRAAQGGAVIQSGCGLSRVAHGAAPGAGKSRAALEESALFTLPGGKQVLKLAPLAEWTTRDVWYACEQLSIPLLPLYELGYSSIGCEPCTSLPLDPNDPRSGRWAGRKVECGIHIQAAPAT